MNRKRAVRALRGRVALVTGASRGIGAAIAEALAAEGCHLVLAARDGMALAGLAARLERTHGVRTLPLATDVGDEDQVRALVERAEVEMGGVDILVNNAGVGLLGAVDGLALADLRAVFDVNLFGAVAAVQAVVPGMRRRGGGAIVNVSSIVGKIPQPLGGGYSATKHALQALSATARAELARDNIAVIVVCPGLTDTEFARHARVSVPGVEARRGEGGPPLPGVSPAKVARRTVEAIRRGEREVYVSWYDRLVVAGALLFPGLYSLGLRWATGLRRRRLARRLGTG